MADAGDSSAAAPANDPAVPATDPSKSLDGSVSFDLKHHRAAHAVQQCARAHLAFVALHAKANLLVEKIVEPVQTKQYGRPIYYYYHTVLQRARWDKPAYLGSRDIVKTAPTYAAEQAAIMLQGVWRRRQSWLRLMAAMCAAWSKTVDPSTGASYYYNYRTGEAKWEKPLLFGNKDVEDFAGVLEAMQAKEKEQVATKQTQAPPLTSHLSGCRSLARSLVTLPPLRSVFNLFAYSSRDPSSICLTSTCLSFFCEDELWRSINADAVSYFVLVLPGG